MNQGRPSGQPSLSLGCHPGPERVGTQRPPFSLTHTLSKRQGITTIIAIMATVQWELTMCLGSTYHASFV